MIDLEITTRIVISILAGGGLAFALAMLLYEFWPDICARGHEREIKHWQRARKRARKRRERRERKC